MEIRVKLREERGWIRLVQPITVPDVSFHMMNSKGTNMQDFQMYDQQNIRIHCLFMAGRKILGSWKNGHSPSMAIIKMSVLGLSLLQGRNIANLRKLPEIHNSKIIVKLRTTSCCLLFQQA